MNFGPYWKEPKPKPPDWSGSHSDDQQPDSTVQLNHRIPAVAIVQQRFQGAASVTVVFTDHALERMRKRDIDRSEVLHALARGPSSHARRKSDGRYSVAAVSPRGRRHGTVRVIYHRPATEVVTVITAFRE